MRGMIIIIVIGLLIVINFKMLRYIRLVCRNKRILIIIMKILRKDVKEEFIN